MVKQIAGLFDRKAIKPEIIMFNIFHIIWFLGIIASCFLVKAFFDSQILLYVTIGMALMFLMIMIEANRTGRFTACAVVMSLTLNIFFFPAIYIIFGNKLLVMPVYFLFGLVYTAIVFKTSLAVALCVIEAVFYYIVIFVSWLKNPLFYGTLTKSELKNNYLAAMAGIILITVCSCAAIRIRDIMYKKKEEDAKKLGESAISEYMSKDMFLTNMSHEIRTPMNAIVGNVNLMLDECEDGKTRDNVYSILSSCDALISIVNELMDLSKTEDLHKNIISERFDIYNMFLEIVNMMSVKMLDDASDFYAEIAAGMPRFLKGDESKLRQIFLNSISSTGKNLHIHRILISLGCESKSSQSIDLIIRVNCIGEPVTDVSDTGDEDQNSKYCNEMITNMGGSAHNRRTDNGAEEVINIPVLLADETETTMVSDDLSSFNVLIWEKNNDRSACLAGILNELNVRRKSVYSVDEFKTVISKDRFTHIMIASDFYSQYYDDINSVAGDEKVISISDVGGNIENRGVYASVLRPLHCINVLGVLEDNDVYSIHRGVNAGDFELVNTTILVVDDNFTNLNVAGALIRKYGANVLTASGGLDAVRILEEEKVDLVFLDYMMPELNGIDTLNMIRNIDNDLSRDVPAIALSANAVSGAYEMFISSGFAGFVPKPIDVAKLEKCLKEFLPKECVKYKRV